MQRAAGVTQSGAGRHRQPAVQPLAGRLNPVAGLRGAESAWAEAAFRDPPDLRPTATASVLDVDPIVSAGRPAREPWDDPPRRPSNATSPVLAVDGFGGPLDWLLEMVRVRKLDLARLSILALVEALGEALTAALTRIYQRRSWRDRPPGR